MTDLDLIVRPFAPAIAGSSRSPRREATAAADEPPTLMIGASGLTINSLNFSFSESGTVTRPMKPKELERTFDVARVENPEDSEQHVEVEVIKELRLAHNPKSTKVEKAPQYKFTPPEESANVKIITTNQKRLGDTSGER